MLTPISIAVADDSPIFRYYIKTNIERIPHFRVGLEATNGAELLEQLRHVVRVPTVCVLDVRMPVLDGFDTLKIIRKKYPRMRVIVLTACNHHYTVSTMIKTGANGFLTKEIGLQFLCVAIEDVIASGFHYSQNAGKEIFDKVLKGPESVLMLTKVERVVLDCFFSVDNGREIAQKLSISIHTVEKHIQNIYRKTGVNTRQSLMCFAIKNDLARFSF